MKAHQTPSGNAGEITDILYRLVGVQSDTGTAMERDAATLILEILREQDYFIAHPELCGAHDAGDRLGRPVVWALRRGSGRRTVILTGHYDAVDIATYGSLKPHALDPPALRDQMRIQATLHKFPDALLRDLENEKWAFGRGIADMKAGLAVSIHTLATMPDSDVNILFVAVSDEENLSAGARQAVDLFIALREQFDLDYTLAILSEPQYRDADAGEDYIFHRGAMGKILPMVVAKGILTHAAETFSGLNSGLIVSEVVRRTELCADLVSEDRGVCAPPPTVLIFKDLKTTYDVSVPEYSVACFNIQFLKSTRPAAIIDGLMDICRGSLDAAVRRYHESFDRMRDRGFVVEADRLEFQPQALTFSELQTRAREVTPDFEAYRARVVGEISEAVTSGSMSLQDACTRYAVALLEASGITQPVTVVGIAPPYYPAVSDDIDHGPVREALDMLPGFIRSRFGIGATERNYLFAMTDMSYLCNDNPARDEEVLTELPLPSGLYGVPIDRIARLNIPTLIIGPASRAPHQIGERVYLPDVTERLPAIFGRIIEQLSEVGTG